MLLPLGPLAGGSMKILRTKCVMSEGKEKESEQPLFSNGKAGSPSVVECCALAIARLMLSCNIT